MHRLRVVLALCAALLVALAPVAAYAQQPTKREAITVSSTAVGMSSATYNPAGTAAQACILTLADAQVRWSVDGVAPTSTVGHVFDVGATLTLRREADFQRFKAIRTGSTDGVLTVSCSF